MSYHQTGPVPPKKIGSTSPLGITESEKQSETGESKGFRMRGESASMPAIQFEHSTALGAKEGSFDAVSPANVKHTENPAGMQDTFGTEENFHTGFVKENEFDNPAAEKGGQKRYPFPSPKRS